MQSLVWGNDLQCKVIIGILLRKATPLKVIQDLIITPNWFANELFMNDVGCIVPFSHELLPSTLAQGN